MRLFKGYTIFLVLFIVQQVIVHIVIQLPDKAVICSDDGSRWIFCDCKLVAPMYVVHVVATMQTGAIARGVFIKTTKKTTLSHEFKYMGAKMMASFSKKAKVTKYCSSDDCDENSSPKN